MRFSKLPAYLRTLFGAIEETGVLSLQVNQSTHLDDSVNPCFTNHTMSTPGEGSFFEEGWKSSPVSCSSVSVPMSAGFSSKDTDKRYRNLKTWRQKKEPLSGKWLLSPPNSDKFRVSLTNSLLFVLSLSLLFVFLHYELKEPSWELEQSPSFELPLIYAESTHDIRGSISKAGRRIKEPPTLSDENYATIHEKGEQKHESSTSSLLLIGQGETYYHERMFRKLCSCFVNESTILTDDRYSKSAHTSKENFGNGFYREADWARKRFCVFIRQSTKKSFIAITTSERLASQLHQQSSTVHPTVPFPVNADGKGICEWISRRSSPVVSKEITTAAERDRLRSSMKVRYTN